MKPAYTLKAILISSVICVAMTSPATGQVIAFDPSNLAAQIKNIAQFRQQLRQLGEQTDLAREVRDAAERAQREYRSFTSAVDRAINLSKAQENVVEQLNQTLNRGGSLSYHMDARGWSDTFAMGRTSNGDSPTQSAREYDHAMNARTMSTVTATMATLQTQEAQVRETTARLDRLGVELERASTIEEKQAIQASIVLLETQREIQESQMEITQLNLSAVLQAVETDAAANAAARQAQEKAAMQQFIDSVKPRQTPQ